MQEPDVTTCYALSIVPNTTNPCEQDFSLNDYPCTYIGVKMFRGTVPAHLLHQGILFRTPASTTAISPLQHINTLSSTRLPPATYCSTSTIIGMRSLGWHRVQFHGFRNVGESLLLNFTGRSTLQILRFISPLSLAQLG